MKDSLKPGFTFNFTYVVRDNKTVPHLFPESEEFQEMPDVLATGFMVGLFEWACVQALKPYLDWPDEQTVGTCVNFTHSAPTPPGLPVTVKGRLTDIRGRKLSFLIDADDGVDQISKGTHERFIINSTQFNRKAGRKMTALKADKRHL